jgi:ABC-type multidrug transport system ATPase subunit
MIFSYKVGKVYLFKDISLPVCSGACVLLTGVENVSFSLIGGIVSGILPIQSKETLPQVEELLKVFTGELEISEGEVQKNSVYLGPDPEKHLFFSRVDEEIYAQTGRMQKQHEVLSLFGLNEGFVRRRIASLSGGEKMKLALSIAFSKSVQYIVLHGILPWLDRYGKHRLLDAIRKKVKEGRGVLVLEQEIEHLRPLAQNICFYNGQSIVPYDPELLTGEKQKIQNVSHKISQKLEKQKGSEDIVIFEGVRFRYDAGPSLLNDVSFTLKEGKMYGLVGDNGSGKSTIARLILRVERPQKGRIFIMGKDCLKIGRSDLVRKICFVGQFPEQYITLSSVDQYRRRAQHRGNTVSQKLLDSYFEKGKSYPISTLSPLELKILSIASSIGKDTRLIILDEPTWGLDLHGEHTLLDILHTVLKDSTGLALLLITHDFQFISRLRAQFLSLKDGCIQQYEKAAKITGHNFFLSQEKC